MRKYLVFLTSFLLSIGVFAQCPISVSLTSIQNVPVCKNASVQLVATPSSGAIGNVTQYVWVVSNDTIATTTVGTTNLLAANQNVTVYMETTTGCAPDPDVVDTTFLVQIIIIEPIANPIIECNQTVGDVEVIPTGNGSSPYTFELSGLGTNSDGMFNNVPVGAYTLFTTDSQGCKDATEVAIAFDACNDPAPIEAISPNGDGFTDTWQIAHIEDYPENEVYIFDRWGQRVYHKKGYENADGWDAQYLGVDLPASTYYYFLEIKSENGGEDIIMNGPISVFR